MLKLLIPRWIKHFPHELDRAALLQLAKAVKNINNPRETIFFIYDIATKEEAENIQYRAEQAGWETNIYPSEKDKTLLMFEATRRDYVFSEQDYSEDVAFFQRLAKEYDAHYDGWVASNE
jgi:hypothetical protein